MASRTLRRRATLGVGASAAALAAWYWYRPDQFQETHDKLVQNKPKARIEGNAPESGSIVESMEVAAKELRVAPEDQAVNLEQARQVLVQAQEAQALSTQLVNSTDSFPESPSVRAKQTFFTPDGRVKRRLIP